MKCTEPGAVDADQRPAARTPMRFEWSLAPDLNSIVRLSETMQVLPECYAAATASVCGDGGGYPAAVRAALPDLTLAATEGLANVVRHGEARDEVAVCVELHCNRVELELRDDGIAFDMSSLPARLPQDPFEQRGRGLFLIHALTDAFGYRRECRRNVHRLVKLL